MSIALSRGFTKLILEIDLKIAMTLIGKSNCDYYSLGALVANCRMLLDPIPELKFKHTYREANAIVDHLAKKRAKSTDHFVVYNNYTTDLGHILYSVKIISSSKCRRTEEWYPSGTVRQPSDIN
ncbi:hypothetical protein SLEP1_g18251 [Rubroshorea leprosula]|uniref:RNase H type-1 domain-containing protein n=1 Tax=Rubroshorea leprosula TaxID=152421 RepID=A0AAV5IWU5_9ROSI|nr:hypothetical protein SLEP1_g18251 [Rubroshorea leprosula]